MKWWRSQIIRWLHWFTPIALCSLAQLSFAISFHFKYSSILGSPRNTESNYLKRLQTVPSIFIPLDTKARYQTNPRSPLLQRKKKSLFSHKERKREDEARPRVKALSPGTIFARSLFLARPTSRPLLVYRVRLSWKGRMGEKERRQSRKERKRLPLDLRNKRYRTGSGTGKTVEGRDISFFVRRTRWEGFAFT